MVEDYFDDDEIKYRRKSAFDMEPDEYLESRLSYTPPEERGQSFGPRPKVIEIPGPIKPTDPTYAKESDIRMASEGMYGPRPLEPDVGGVQEMMAEVPEGSSITAGGKTYTGKMKKAAAGEAVDYANFDLEAFSRHQRERVKAEYGVDPFENPEKIARVRRPGATPKELQEEIEHVMKLQKPAYEIYQGVVAVASKKASDAAERTKEKQKTTEDAYTKRNSMLEKQKSAVIALQKAAAGETDSFGVLDVEQKAAIEGLGDLGATKYLKGHIQLLDGEINRVTKQYGLEPLQTGKVGGEGVLFQTHKPFEETAAGAGAKSTTEGSQSAVAATTRPEVAAEQPPTVVQTKRHKETGQVVDIMSDGSYVTRATNAPLSSEQPGPTVKKEVATSIGELSKAPGKIVMGMLEGFGQYGPDIRRQDISDADAQGMVNVVKKAFPKEGNEIRVAIQTGTPEERDLAKQELIELYNRAKKYFGGA